MHAFVFFTFLLSTKREGETRVCSVVFPTLFCIECHSQYHTATLLPYRLQMCQIQQPGHPSYAMLIM